MMQYQAWAANGMGGRELQISVPQISSFFLKFVHVCVSLFKSLTVYFHLQHSQIGDAMFLSLGQLNLSFRHNFDKENIRRGGRGFVGHGFVESISLRVDSLNIHSIYSNPGLRY